MRRLAGPSSSAGGVPGRRAGEGRSSASAVVKGWPGWVALVLVLTGLLAVGASRDDGPSTPEERGRAIAERVACPTCQGESVADSRSTASEQIRSAIGRLVDAGAASDEEILAILERNYGGQVLLVPRASGLDALAWALPVAALVCAVAALAVTFRRWRREAAAERDPTDEDRRLVAAALADEPGDG